MPRRMGGIQLLTLHLSNCKVPYNIFLMMRPWAGEWGNSAVERWEREDDCLLFQKISAFLDRIRADDKSPLGINELLFFFFLDQNASKQMSYRTLAFP